MIFIIKLQIIVSIKNYNVYYKITNYWYSLKNYNVYYKFANYWYSLKNYNVY